MTDSAKKRLKYGGFLIALGIVYGDIGTSPLYTMNAIIAGNAHTDNMKNLVIGSISLVFWTLMLITTVKYVLIALQADNHGEGGIFSLYSKVRNRNMKWLIIPAMVGGAALLADGALTPAVTVTSAVEGLEGQKFGSLMFPTGIDFVVPVVLTILLVVFTLQRKGTTKIGRMFGPMMLIWFTFIGFFGLLQVIQYPEILKALSPVYAVQTLFSPDNRLGIFILGNIFLATTGAEALYSDMGHVGKRNIYLSWPFVYVTLVLNYMGQGAWVIMHNASGSNLNLFFDILPNQWRLVGVILSTIAAVIASQALITGAFTLVSEAISLKIMPRLRITYPNDFRGQMYISIVNWMLFVAGVVVVVLFQTSHNMESAYGLAITVTMLMTTTLLFEFIRFKTRTSLAILFAVPFGLLETLFLIASLGKFIHGGYFTVILMLLILSVMVFWFYGNKRREALSYNNDYLSLKDYRRQLMQLSNDSEEPLMAKNLVYIVNVHDDYQIKKSVIYSLLGARPKRAKVYWFVTIRESINPYEKSYSVDLMGSQNMVRVVLNLGFKVDPQVEYYIHQIAKVLVKQGVLEPQKIRYGLDKNRSIGDFKYVITNNYYTDLKAVSKISSWDRFLIGGRIWLQSHSVHLRYFYRLRLSDTVEEVVPLFIEHKTVSKLRQLEVKNQMPKMDRWNRRIDDPVSPIDKKRRQDGDEHPHRHDDHHHE
ncbi:KUP/HAK/KT family potassium transporter [Fructobacillus tropaeoli]|uniref:Probable potassium transport system protein Kup n=1 Tax=Fructobacillus tropaeoli TaxID=709323 RepID=A0A3F3H1F0_9LACO|nr:KUP/HAK/KT family potassium transporter [Fructobacillus tropaeoli]CAK1229955.1 K+ uptake protein Kup (Kup) [Fructobacillus tropaeoli]CAK1242572.1 K+ uptake protein Kup (Kup) [Fructobacillus tropaeoli]CAK1244353.1 K+ uptake protein Kup (Kup) [Fructobacillus tropaeoli]GAP04424.1 K+ transporter [Fructobacillus tropaeoli]GIC70334.1 KUP/HAK/KT family potassium transporter [Fructobacillus tropaeoli]